MKKSKHSYIRQLTRTPLTLRWFILLVFLRPLFDTLYELKHVSVFASPLYWIGILTPVIVVLSILSKRLRVAGDASFVLWFVLVSLNSVVIMIVGLNAMDSFMTVLKISTIGYLYFYIRVMALTETQYVLLIKSFAYSAMFVYAYILIEVIGLGGAWGGRTSGGVEQMVGPFADAVSYGMYLNLSLAAWLYLYFKEAVHSKLVMVLVVGMTIYGVASIAHVASISLMGCLLLLYVISTMKERRTAVVLGLLSLVVVGFSMSSDILEERYQPKVDREIQVLRGERDDGQAFHGRMTRWNMMFPMWIEMGILAKLLGVAFEMEGVRHHSYWVLVQPHNDFLRILFTSGILGLIFYLRWLYRSVIRSLNMKAADKFIAQSSVVIVLVYSITTLPTIYPAVIYFLVSTIGYVESRSSAPR